MAELPRYRPLGVALAPAPRVDYAGAAATEARGWQSMSQSLDRMSNYAFEEAAKRAEREGTEFGYKLDITPEQFKAAVESGRSVDDIIGDPGTVFGAASRASVGLRLKTQLEGQARENLSVLAAMVDGGEKLDTEDLKIKIDGMMAGHAEILSQIDPKLAYNYRATVGTLASSVYKGALEQEYKLRSAILLSQVGPAIEDTTRLVQRIYNADQGASTIIDGVSVYAAHAEADVALKSLLDSAIETNDTSVIAAVSKETKEIKKNAIINALQKYARENPKAVDINNGIFGNKTALYQSLDENDKEAVRDAARDENTARYNERIQAITLASKQATIEYNQLSAQIISMSPDDPRRESLVRKVEALARSGYMSISEDDLNNFKNPASKMRPSDPTAVSSTERLIILGQFPNVTDLEIYVNNQNINIKDKVSLIEKQQAYEKSVRDGVLKDVMIARSIINPNNMTKDQSLLVGKAVREIYEENDKVNQERKAKGQPLEDLRTTARNYLSNKETANLEENLINARAALNQAANDLRLTVNLSDHDVSQLQEFLPTIDKMANLSKSQKQDLKERVNYMIKALSAMR